MKTSVFSTALGKNQPDRSYYKSLYKFNPKVELADYSLPFYDNATGKATVTGAKLSSGLINATKLPPLEKEEVKDIQQEKMEDEEDLERAEEENVTNDII